MHEHVSILHEGEEQFYCGKCDSFFSSEVDYANHLSQHAKALKRKAQVPISSPGGVVHNDILSSAIAQSNLDFDSISGNVPQQFPTDPKRQKMVYTVQAPNQTNPHVRKF